MRLIKPSYFKKVSLWSRIPSLRNFVKIKVGNGMFLSHNVALKKGSEAESSLVVIERLFMYILWKAITLIEYIWIYSSFFSNIKLCIGFELLEDPLFHPWFLAQLSMQQVELQRNKEFHQQKFGQNTKPITSSSNVFHETWVFKCELAQGLLDRNSWLAPLALLRIKKKLSVKLCCLSAFWFVCWQFG